MKHLFLLLLLLCFSAAAQQRVPVNGKVSYQGTGLENGHVQNISSMQFSISTRAGNFRISLAAGDTLIFSHVSMKDLIRVVEQQEITSEEILVEMQENDTELREVVIEDQQKIDALSLGIITERKERPTMNERRLQTAGDFKWYHLLGILGGSVQIDPILNAINGRTKQLKKNINAEQRMEKIRILEHGYMEYMKENFGAPEGEIQQFLDYLVDQESLTPVLNSGNEDQMRFFLLDQWFRYREERSSESEIRD